MTFNDDKGLISTGDAVRGIHDRWVTGNRDGLYWVRVGGERLPDRTNDERSEREGPQTRHQRCSRTGSVRLLMVAEISLLHPVHLNPRV
jgi:hypothetical protein